jgi:Zn-dependent protease with chaperone function
VGLGWSSRFQLLLTWLAPSLIMPLFNKFTPMPDGDLKREIEELGKRCGFPLDGVFVMDGSKRSTKANAFFTGFGKRKKIALFDTLVRKAARPSCSACSPTRSAISAAATSSNASPPASSRPP